MMKNIPPRDSCQYSFAKEADDLICRPDRVAPFGINDLCVAYIINIWDL